MMWPDWWVFVIMALTVFFGCLLLNYFVNKINETQLERRLITLQMKSPEGRVTQVHDPLLEKVTNQARLPLPTIKKSEIGHELKTIHKAKESYQISESQIEKIITKPIFLGNIYRSTELIERPSSNGDIGKTDEKQTSEADECYYQDILNELLDRMMAKIDNAKVGTDLMKILEIGKSMDELKSSKGTISFVSGVKSGPINDSLIINDILDDVMLKINKPDERLHS